MKIKHSLLIFLIFLQGCAGLDSALGIQRLEIPPEYKQEIYLEAASDYAVHQAARSVYDTADLQSFHTQHTFPVVIEGAMREIFGKVTLLTDEKKAAIAARPPDVPAIFEIRIIDLGHDIFSDADNYRATITMAAAMKSPEGHILWQKSFRGDGYTRTDPSFSNQMGHENAITDALRDALDKMKSSIVMSPVIRQQMADYQSLKTVRQDSEVRF